MEILWAVISSLRSLFGAVLSTFLWMELFVVVYFLGLF